MSELIPVLLLTVCFPLWIIFHYVTKWKTSKGLSPEDEKMLSEIWESVNKMEERINTCLLYTSDAADDSVLV